MYLNTHTYYSLRYGTMSPETLIGEALRNEVKALALTDINNTMGTVDFVKLCLQNNIYPVAGIEFRNGDRYMYTGIARNNKGFMELNEFLSMHNENKEEFPAKAPELNNVWFIYNWDNKPAKLSGNELIGIRPSDINKLISSPYGKRNERLIMWHPVSFANREEYHIHRHLRAIDHNTLLSKLTPGQLAGENEIMLPTDLFLCAYEDHPEIVRNTEKLINDCNIYFDYSSVKNKATFTGSRYDDKTLLEKLVMEGLVYRYGKQNKEAEKRVRHELGIIDKLGFSSYFLITWDIIRAAFRWFPPIQTLIILYSP